MEVRRSVLFMAINNPRFLRGAARHNCDGVILDLEDAVAEVHKAYARTLPREAYQEVSRGGAAVQIRINHMPWEADLEGCVWPGLSSITYPKTEYGEEIRRLDRLELAGPVIAIMRPRQPGGPVRLPFGREAHRGMSSSRRSKSHDLKREAGEPRSRRVRRTCTS